MTAPGGGAVIDAAAGRLSHELRNALSGITGALDVLRDRLPPDERIEEVLARVRQELDRIDRSVAELKTFAAPKTPVLRAAHLHGVIERALTRHPTRAMTRVSREYVGDLPPMKLDEALMLDALARLFDNAFDAMPQGGTLTVRTELNGARVRLDVQDTGTGLTPECQTSVFEPFYSGKSRGLGLGLTIVRRHVLAHGGSISVSPIPGGGTEFTILLPVLADRRP